MKLTEIPGSGLHVYVAGTGAPILLVHGFPLRHDMWREQFSALAARYQVIAPDLRGFGASAPASGMVTMEQYADDCRQVLDALGVTQPVVFCGLSMGGYIGWQWMRKYADRTRGLILCDTRAVADSAEAAEGRRKLSAQVLESGNEVVARAMLPKMLGERTRTQHPGLVEEVRRMMLATEPRGMASALAGMSVRPDSTPMLGQIRVPTLVLVGDEDVISVPAEMRQIAAAIPGAEFVIVPDSGHMAPLENPAAVNASLIDFLEKLDRVDATLANA